MNQIATSSGVIPLSLIAITILISALAFFNETVMQKLIFFGPAVSQRGEWFRLFTHGFLHKDLFHIFFNLFTLYSFGDSVVTIFETALGGFGGAGFAVFYLVAIVAAIMPTYLKHKNDHSYYSLGASGAISAIIALDVLSEPGMHVLVYGISVPGWAYLLIFIAISIWLGRNPNSMVNHSAHLYGAAFGIVAAIGLGAVSGQNVVSNFIQGQSPVLDSAPTQPTTSGTSYSFVGVGQCVNIPSGETFPTDDSQYQVDCLEEHDYEVFYQFDPSLRPVTDQEFIDLAEQECDPAFEIYVGVPYAESELDYTYSYPLAETDAEYPNNPISCFVGFRDTTTIGGSLKGYGK
jgi:membrane associated rhomboid family serine protease